MIISSCNSGNASLSTNKLNSSNLKKIDVGATVDMDIKWTVDGVVPENALNSSLRDMGWHLVTMSVARIGNNVKPIAVDGLLAGIYPAPSPNLGQSIEIHDVNCNSAVFSKVGDSCSSYFKLKYDLNKGRTKTVAFPVQMAPKSNELSSLLSFTAKVDPTISIADYRFANVNEEQYYAAPKIISEKHRYIIQVVENGSLSPVKLTTLQQPNNPLFDVVHRTSALNDPYYGNNKECALSDNYEVQQVNQLTDLTESCIVIYRAATTSTVSEAVDKLAISSSANYFFPTWNDKFKLRAIYTVGTNLPDHNISQNNLTGVVDRWLPFNKYQLSFNIYANKIADVLQNENNPRALLVKDGTDISNREIFAVNHVNQIERGSITGAYYKFADGSQLSSGDASVGACGGASANSSAQAISYKTLTQQGLVRIHMQNNSNGDCGGWFNSAIDLNVPMDWFDQEVYSRNQKGCGGNNWDIGGFVRVRGGCDSVNCNYEVAVTAKHGGVGNQCKDSQTRTYNLTFPRPNTNIYLATSGINSYPTQIFYGGTRFSLGMGASGNICNSTNYEAFTYNGNGNFAIGASCYGNPYMTMNYAISPGAGQQLTSGVVKFNRSSGYDLVDFNAIAE